MSDEWSPLPCPVCNAADNSCEHLLLVIEGSTHEVVAGCLRKKAEALRKAFDELLEQVVVRQATCGTDLIYEATRTFFQSYGYIAGTDQSYAELARDFPHEYLMEALDRAPNLIRKTIRMDDEEHEAIWSEMPEVARSLVTQRISNLQRLIFLPEDSVEWMAADDERL